MSKVLYGEKSELLNGTNLLLPSDASNSSNLELQNCLCNKWREAVSRGLPNSAWSAFTVYVEFMRGCELSFGVLPVEDFVDLTCKTLDILMNAEEKDGEKED